MISDTKERILITALKMFSEKGYEGTNLRELLAELGFTKGLKQEKLQVMLF